MAGSEGTRLQPLTRDRAKPAVPFGGKYRIIDFVLSNFINSEKYMPFTCSCSSSRSRSSSTYRRDGGLGVPPRISILFPPSRRRCVSDRTSTGYGGLGVSKHPPHQAVQTGYCGGLWSRTYLPYGHPSDGGVSSRTRRRGDGLGLPGCELPRAPRLTFSKRIGRTMSLTG